MSIFNIYKTIQFFNIHNKIIVKDQENGLQN